MKTKRYAGEEDSLVSDDDKAAINASENFASPAKEEKSKPSSFKEAFAAARSSGDKTFSFNGKSYTTELASSAPKKSSPMPQVGKSNPSMSASPSKSSSMDDDESLSLSDRMSRSRDRARTSGSTTDYRSLSDRLKGSSEEASKPTPSSNKIDLRSPATAMRSLISSREATDNRPVNQRIKEALGMKKGGSVKKMAFGGSVSSASRRADGIATKGKTRGKIC
jgi:hypothetical protein